jgi:hypothetical protein
LNLLTRRSVSYSFYCSHRRIADTVDCRDARTGWSAVQMNRAGAAERHATAKFRAGHAEDVTEHPQQRGIAIDIGDAIETIDFDFESHASSPNVPIKRALKSSAL